MWRILLVVLSLIGSYVFITRNAPVYSAPISQILIDDMSLQNEGKLHGVPDSWSWNNGPELSGNTIPSQYNAIQGWGHLYEAASGNTSTNTRVALRNMETWWLSKSTNKWKRVQSSPNNVEGAAFREDYAGNASENPDLKIIGGYQAVRPGNGHNFHFWHPGGGYDIPAADRGDFGGVVTVIQAKLVLDNPAGPDDRSRAKYLLSSALDLYFSVQNHGTPPIPSLGIGRAKYVTSEWTLFTFNSVSPSNASLIQTNPPPIENPGGTQVTPTNPPAGSCERKAQGDADCNGSITLADYVVWRGEYRGGCSSTRSSAADCGDDMDGNGNLMDADFTQDNTVTLADYQGWRRSFVVVVPQPTSPSSSACVGASGRPLKVMPLGDSITGGTWQMGYRGVLQDKLKAANVSFDFVGNWGQDKPQDWVDWGGRGFSGVWYGRDTSDVQTAASLPQYDPDYEGHGGFQAGQPRSVVGYSDHMLAQMVPGDIPKYSPDVVLMHIGFNDVGGGWSHHGPWSTADAAKNVLDLIDTIHRIAPNTWILVSPNRTGADRAIEEGVTLRMSQGKKLKWVGSMFSQFTDADMMDAAHPGESGYRKMANEWYGVLYPMICR